MKRSMKSLFTVIGGLSTVLLAGSAAQAFPVTIPLTGPTGLGTTPTTDTVPAGDVEVGLQYERVKPDGGHVNFLPLLSGTYGFNKGEVGVAYIRERDSFFGLSDTSNDFAVHAKYRLFQSHILGASVAIGGHYLHFDNGNGNVSSVYLTGSYPFMHTITGQNLVGHLGLLYQHASEGDSSSKVRPMLGLEYRLPVGFSVGADYVPHSGDFARTMSLVGRYESPCGLGGQIGVGQLHSDNSYFAGLTYRFNGPKHHASTPPAAAPVPATPVP